LTVQITQLSDVIGAGVHFNPFVEWRNKVIFFLLISYTFAAHKDGKIGMHLQTVYWLVDDMERGTFYSLFYWFCSIIRHILVPA
jgi:hypothetical protein